MQLVRAMPVSASHYVSAGFHRKVEPPTACPRCGALDELEAHSYYSRSVTGEERGVLRISVRRFRCCVCRKTVSILPSFAQPYRLVLNATISKFFDGTLVTGALSWLPLLRQYWNRFAHWLPEIDCLLRSVVARSPPQPDAAGWWQAVVAAFGNLEKITLTLVSRFGATLFGRYRCHSGDSWK